MIVTPQEYYNILEKCCAVFKIGEKKIDVLNWKKMFLFLFSVMKRSIVKHWTRTVKSCHSRSTLLRFIVRCSKKGLPFKYGCRRHWPFKVEYCSANQIGKEKWCPMLTESTLQRGLGWFKPVGIFQKHYVLQCESSWAAVWTNTREISWTILKLPMVRGSEEIIILFCYY